MRGKVDKWGNSLAIRIPKALAEDAKLKRGAEVEMKVERGKLSVRVIKASTYSLDGLLAGIKPSNLHGETATEPPKGKERL